MPKMPEIENNNTTAPWHYNTTTPQHHGTATPQYNGTTALLNH
jgi:hypothetical protein